MNKTEKQKAKNLIETLRHALPPECSGLALEVDKLYGELRRSQSARDAQRDAECAAKLSAARTEMQAQYERRAKELASELAVDMNRRYEEAEAARTNALTTCVNDMAETTRDLKALKRCMPGGLELYMFCDDYDDGKLARLEMAALMALADWARDSDTEVAYLDGATGYAFFICKACPRSPTILLGVPRREIDRLNTPLPTRKVRRTGRKLFERRVFESIPGAAQREGGSHYPERRIMTEQQEQKKSEFALNRLIDADIAQRMAGDVDSRLADGADPATVREVYRRLGEGWKTFSPEIQEELVAETTHAQLPASSKPAYFRTPCLIGTRAGRGAVETGIAATGRSSNE